MVTCLCVFFSVQFLRIVNTFFRLFSIENECHIKYRKLNAKKNKEKKKEQSKFISFSESKIEITYSLSSICINISNAHTHTTSFAEMSALLLDIYIHNCWIITDNDHVDFILNSISSVFNTFDSVRFSNYHETYPHHWFTIFYLTFEIKSKKSSKTA